MQAAGQDYDNHCRYSQLEKMGVEVNLDSYVAVVVILIAVVNPNSAGPSTWKSS